MNNSRFLNRFWFPSPRSSSPHSKPLSKYMIHCLMNWPPPLFVPRRLRASVVGYQSANYTCIRLLYLISTHKNPFSSPERRNWVPLLNKEFLPTTKGLATSLSNPPPNFSNGAWRRLNMKFWNLEYSGCCCCLDSVCRRALRRRCRNQIRIPSLFYKYPHRRLCASWPAL